jgi:hypothetical protein
VREDGQLLSLTYERERWAWAQHETHGKVEAVCSIPEGEEDAVYLVVVRMLGDGSMRRYIERMTSRVQRGGAEANDVPELETQPDDICVDCALEYFGPAGISTLTGLDHLEGNSVWVLVQDREPLGPFPVVGGEVDLGEELAANLQTGAGPRLVLHAGLAFTAELETLDVPGDKLREKTVVQVGWEVDESRGLATGMDFDHLEEWQQRDVEDNYDPVSNATTLVYTEVPSEWNKSARIVLRQEAPLPITVVGVTRELDSGTL